ncbi:hypothetical protein [Ferrithrix thermotolerans]|nr:hypothetical protein [Ferrithrix thermotolerans]
MGKIGVKRRRWNVNLTGSELVLSHDPCDLKYLVLIVSTVDLTLVG